MSTVLRVTRLAAVVLVLCGASVGARGQTVVGGYNVNGAPQPFMYYGSVLESIGWYYTPPTNLLINGIQTQFGEPFAPGLDRDVTAQILTDRPALGGSLLRSTVFNSALAVGGYGGGAFADLQLTAGERVFIGFLNVNQLGVNMIEPPGDMALPYWSENSYGQFEAGPWTADAPIVRLVYTAGTVEPGTVPEPATMLLLGGGLAAVGALRRRRAGARS